MSRNIRVIVRAGTYTFESRENAPGSIADLLRYYDAVGAIEGVVGGTLEQAVHSLETFGKSKQHIKWPPGDHPFIEARKGSCINVSLPSEMFN